MKDMLSFLIARDTMHQNHWLAAIQELEADELETTPCPSGFPRPRPIPRNWDRLIRASMARPKRHCHRWHKGPGLLSVPDELKADNR
ncbi:manganese catalase family protein [Azospirillum brasilense]|uniref:manganese catalase family protein n=1 Tax=Azospirillum brasilense TaxID=192 RepID=UPI0024959806|nr:manganese catalase family protein [Azospirillum brasilense]